MISLLEKAKERRKLFCPTQGGLLGLIFAAGSLVHEHVKADEKESGTCSCSNDAGAELGFSPPFLGLKGSLPSSLGALKIINN